MKNSLCLNKLHQNSYFINVRLGADIQLAIHFHIVQFYS